MKYFFQNKYKHMQELYNMHSKDSARLISFGSGEIHELADFLVSTCEERDSISVEKEALHSQQMRRREKNENR